MVKTENIVINDTAFKRTYSDENYYIQKVGTDEIYSEAVDVLDKNYTYVETDEKFEAVISSEIKCLSYKK